MVGGTVRSAAEAVADEIVGLLERGTVRDKTTGIARAAKPADIAILFRSRDSHREFEAALERLNARGIANTGRRDRHMFDAVYFQDPLGLLIELSAWKFEPPAGFTHTDVLHRAQLLRVEAGARAIEDAHLVAAIEALALGSTRSLSVDRSAKNPYAG